MNILEEIVGHKKRLIKEKKSLYPVKLLEKSIFFETKCVSLKKYILRTDKHGIIAEFKRKSPSKGDINTYADVEKVSLGYMQAGASALSVLTDKDYFGGTNNDLETARKFNFCPILRKDFIVDEYQIYESKAIGADAILLIAAALKPNKIEEFTKKAHNMGMDVLLEVHNEKELKANIDTEADLIGVNNRNLSTFEVDINTSKELAAIIGPGRVSVSESGLSKPESILELKKFGYKGFLVGQHFMETADPGLACKKFIEKMEGI